MRGWLLLALCLALAACSKAPDRQQGQALSAFDVAEPPTESAPATASGGTPGSGAPGPITVSVPQIAYIYSYSFSLPVNAVAKTQQAHIALCDRLGAARCQVLAMTSTNSDADAAKATLKLRVASSIARRFGADLSTAVGKAGGRAIDQSIKAEDVSKDIVDTTARLKQREMLVARLTEILRTRQGKVAELVEAERSVAAAQEEIDQARSWLAELQGRVALSTIDIDYAAVAAPAAQVGGGIGDAVAGSASAFVLGLGGIASVLIYLAPWLVVFGLGLWLMRRFLPPLRPTRYARIVRDGDDAAPPSCPPSRPPS